MDNPQENQIKTPAPAAGTLPPAPKKGAGPIDPNSFVLPNKEIHSILNAQRAEAGILLSQEKSATLPTPPLPGPAPILHKTPDSELVVPLQTYQSDMEKYVRSQQVTPVKAVAAEEKRRAVVMHPVSTMSRQDSEEPAKRKYLVTQIVAFAGGLFLLLGAGLGLFFVYMKMSALPQTQNTVSAFIQVDDTQDILFDHTDTEVSAMEKLIEAKRRTQVAEGLLSQIRLFDSQSATAVVPLQTFFETLTPHIPDDLSRIVGEEYVLGVHAYDGNQPFLLFTVDSYANGYAGMLAWEKTMQSDLSPLFEYSPKHSDSGIIASSTPSTKIILSPFSDTILENHDTRTIHNGAGDLVFLWTFLDRSTILITTNENTLHEIITRLRSSTKLTVPQ